VTADSAQPPLIGDGSGSSSARPWLIVIALGIGHMIVDATSIFAIQRAAGNTYGAPGEDWMRMVYNLLAFATQFALGWAVDWLRAARLAAVAGAAMAACSSVLCAQLPVPAMIAAGLGNALFHVGAGAIVLTMSRGGAAMPGVFVGPGDFGVILGSAAGWGAAPMALPLAGASLAVGAFVASMQPPGAPASGDAARARPRWGLVVGLAALLCFSVAVRALSAGALTAPWREDWWIWGSLVLVAVSAKASGGLLADQLGWMRIGAGSALAAAVWIGLLGFADPSLAVVGATLAQMAMPVTLAALWWLMPARPGLAFGLASSSLSLVDVLQLAAPAAMPPSGLIWAVQLAGAVSLAVALWRLPQTRTGFTQIATATHRPG
jgi:FSR family fosmidomycin resistance protein-like MFS transporter